jgi:hypothetical protein
MVKRWPKNLFNGHIKPGAYAPGFARKKGRIFILPEKGIYYEEKV